HRIAANGIISPTDEGLPPSEPHVPNNHIMGIDPDCLPGYTHPIPRCRLAGNGNIGCPDNKRGVEPDNSSYIKYNDSSATLFQSLPQSTRPAVLQTGNGYCPSSSTSITEHPPAFGTGKCGDLRLWKVIWSPGPRDIGLSFFFFLKND